ncbi:helix-turn-helix domain-containing protein [Mycobacterium sp. NPDC004974]
MSENDVAVAASEPPKLYTMEETAEVLRVSREYLYRMRKNGDLVVVRFGRRILVEATEIDRVIAAARAA